MNLTRTRTTRPAADPRPDTAPRTAPGGALRALAVACAVVLSGLVAVPPDTLLARTFVEFARLGDRVERDVRAGDTYAFHIDLLAGTDLDLRLDDRGDGDGVLTLTLKDSEDNVLGHSASEPLRVGLVVPRSSRYRVEVRSSADTEFRLRFDGDPPASVGGQVTVSGGSATVHLDLARGATAEVEVRRVKAGAPPEVVAVRDGLGRTLAFSVRRASAKRVRLHPVPVSAPGGLYVEVTARGGGGGTYEVRASGRREPDDDDPEPGPPDVVLRRLVLVLAPGADPAAVAAALGHTLVPGTGGSGFVVVETAADRPPGTEQEDALAAELALPGLVLAAEPDAHVELPEGSQSNSPVLGSDFGRAFDRSDFENQPALVAVRAQRAHTRATGAGVVVAVLDTGIDPTHELFQGRLLPGTDLVDPADQDGPLEVPGAEGELGFGHGTFVAGLVLAAAPDAVVMPVRVLGPDGRGTVSAIVAGIEYAVENGAHVVNLSLGMRPRSEILGDAVRFALANGVVVVAATGNRADLTATDFPSRMRGAVGVTALDETFRRRAPFASSALRTTLGAPGTDLVGPYPDPTDRFVAWSGTSFATALVSGGAALVLERSPGLRPNQVQRRLARRARPAPPRLPRPERRLLGHGRLDLPKLVR
jgi:hypothetical protein